MGHSAGAHIVSLVGTDRGLQISSGMSTPRATVVLDTAEIDLEAVMQNAPSRLYTRAFGTAPSVWHNLSPMRQLDPDAAPLLVVCSTQRHGVCVEARAYRNLAAKVNVKVSVLPIDKSYAAINGDLGKPSLYTNAVSDWIDQQIDR